MTLRFIVTPEYNFIMYKGRKEKIHWLNYCNSAFYII